jgi:hypothetical protein
MLATVPVFAPADLRPCEPLPRLDFRVGAITVLDAPDVTVFL